MSNFFRNLNIITNLKSFNAKTIESTKNAALRLEEKSKGTMFENWIRYWKNVFNDYREVVIDVRKDIREKPIKAVCTLTIIGSLTYCVKHNPNFIDYRDTFVKSANELLLVHPSMQKTQTASTLKQIEGYFNSGVVRRFNFGVASIIWVDYYSASCKNSEAICKHLKMSYFDWRYHIIDIGFLDRWWMLSKCMEDYDIND
ncbi:hypothetical protein PPYR_13275 [Photinus pyralis]|uniref:Mitochondrial import inner membrane translocase subunit Tim29 n=1 Tax=Photinus pyralis TaxID=7054 RepID=A0A1Y1M937_PHOPY|nr:mitochondrial import inner membrane translocase subunit Tim29-like [Photinus pyralis]KAB0793655.1 hypothetical protein PPYR_13275 [Photinus pyralis]